MKVQILIDATEQEKVIVKAINDIDEHLKLISKQYAELLKRVNKIEDEQKKRQTKFREMSY